MDQRRRETRTETKVPIRVLFLTVGAPLNMHTRDISPGGAYIESPMAFDVGDNLICAFSLSEEEIPFAMLAEVVRVEKDRAEGVDWPAGFAVEFLDTKPTERLHLRSLLN